MKINRRQFSQSLLKSIGIIYISFFFIKRNKLFACDPCGSASIGIPSSGSLGNAGYMSGSNVLLKPGQNFYGNAFTNSAFASAADSAGAWGYGMVGITDISAQNGGYLYPHSRHQNGLCVDFRYLGANGGPNNVAWSTYNFQANLDFITEVNNQHPLNTVFVGDAVLKDSLVSRGIPASYDVSGGHADHGHLTFTNPCY